MPFVPQLHLIVRGFRCQADRRADAEFLPGRQEFRSAENPRRARRERGGSLALVTGGSRGVGFATVERLLKLGANVAITASGMNRLEESRKKLSQWGGIALPGDVGKWEDARRMAGIPAKTGKAGPQKA